ncbi:ABC transporter ATP-binding protein [Sedimentibacter hydroxybenzoicus DSM 7310]|uniref:ABC transporter ATP-binding protein n=1 Tax=Sedimentibacter hydroxybenzoicus DSM 7310 TaxID=1123245 RepID=A0A974BLI7_SEDHY|nr:ABC transporter ATP-binding protein [Sedimentibacter hydroxybenzoicus]NYB75178.1 ABC transporter ATP-binding protein [Sedimentibacter hydroxybenzoicus DSM 7310]
MNVIETRKLTKSYGRQEALRGVDLTVKQGEVYGFIGPNGSGKSTTIRILLGMLRKSGGEAKLLGGDPWADAVELHRRIAYVPGDVTLWPNLTGGEVINLLNRLGGKANTSRIKELLDRFQLDPKKRCRSYSKGNRQKVALVAALSSDAELLILDEPTSGLDPLMEQIFQECIFELKKQGKTIFLSSHILAEVEALCDRVGIIRQGEIVEEGTLEELRHLTRTTVTVELAKSMSLNQLQGIHDISRKEEKWRFSVDVNAMDEVINAIAPMGIKSLTVEPSTLEELFIRHYGDDIQEKAVK